MGRSIPHIICCTSEKLLDCVRDTGLKYRFIEGGVCLTDDGSLILVTDQDTVNYLTGKTENLKTAIEQPVEMMGEIAEDEFLRVVLGDEVR